MSQFRPALQLAGTVGLLVLAYLEYQHGNITGAILALALAGR